MDKFNKDVFENSFQKIIDSLENHVNKDGTKDTRSTNEWNDSMNFIFPKMPLYFFE